jgi:hypothetical protein
MRAASSGKNRMLTAWRFCSRSVQTWESLRVDHGRDLDLQAGFYLVLQ